MIRTADELKQQAIKNHIDFWPVHNCSICGYACGYYFENNHEDVFYDAGCDCVNYSNVQKRSWENLADNYNLNQPENNPKIKQEYLDELNKIWKFEEAK
jgi:hypothetical protein